MINNLLSTAQNAPACWFGTVLPLQNDQMRISARKGWNTYLGHIPDIIVRHSWIRVRPANLPSLRFKAVDGFDIIDKYNYITCNDEKQSN